MILCIINLIFWGILGFALAVGGLRINRWQYWLALASVMGIHLTAFLYGFI